MIVTGSRAPAFSLRSGAYSETTLLDYVGTTLVLVFYVADWHPVCSEQLRRYSELLPELRRLGAELLAISPDTLLSHAAFAAAKKLSFPLLADDRPRGKIAAEYGVSDAQRALF